MYKECMTKSSALRQHELAQALFCVLKVHPLNSITISKLCEKAKIPRKAFYRYFEVKDDIIIFLLDEAAQEYEIKINTDEKAAISVKLTNFFEYWHSKQDLLLLLKNNNIDSLLPTRFISRFLKTQSFAMSAVHGTNKAQLRAVAIFTVSGLYALLSDWRDTGFARSSAELAALAETLLMQPLFKKLEE